MDAMLDLDYGFSLGLDSGIIRWLVTPPVEEARILTIYSPRCRDNLRGWPSCLGNWKARPPDHRSMPYRISNCFRSNCGKVVQTDCVVQSRKRSQLTGISCAASS